MNEVIPLQVLRKEAPTRFANAELANAAKVLYDAVSEGLIHAILGMACVWGRQFSGKDNGCLVLLRPGDTFTAREMPLFLDDLEEQETA